MLATNSDTQSVVFKNRYLLKPNLIFSHFFCFLFHNSILKHDLRVLQIYKEIDNFFIQSFAKNG